MTFLHVFSTLMRGVFKSYLFCPLVLDICRCGAKNMQWGREAVLGISGAKPPAAGGTGVWGRASTLENFVFIWQT